MKPQELQQKIEELLGLPCEIEWVEFKHNVFAPDRIGRDISALSNSACLHYQPCGYLLWGVEDGTRRIVGTNVKPKSEKVGNEGFENWLTTQLSPKVNFQFYDLSFSSQRLVLLMVDAAKGNPVLFGGTGYVRVGSCTRNLKELPDKERQIWQSSKDWSAEICPEASIDDLHPEALQKARLLYSQKNPEKQAEIAAWDDLTFLNKAKLAIQGKITRTAILLLGVPESSGYLSPSQAQVTWVVYDEKNNSRDYEHFGLPFLLQADRILAKIRNLNYRYLPEGTLFSTEITKYDPYVIREALHNCIAHQDYTLCGRIAVAEKPDELIFTNPGTFIPGSVEAVITQNSPPAYYRNPFLAAAMVQLKMIDTIGSGIRRLFEIQRERFFPLPDYEFLQEQVAGLPTVTLRIQGKILDEHYTRLLIRTSDLKLEDVMLLDKVQKRQKISNVQCDYLRKLRFIKGRYPNIFISSVLASKEYTRHRVYSDQHYIEMILSFLGKHHKASRKDFDDLLRKNLPDTLSEEQKKNKIRNIMYKMSKKDRIIENIGTNKKPIWVKKHVVS